MASKFWKKVQKCKHEHISNNYDPYIACFCGRAYEEHCLDCGAYITTDPCGEQAGISGWSDNRWKTYWEKRSMRSKQKVSNIKGLKGDLDG